MCNSSFKSLPNGSCLPLASFAKREKPAPTNKLTDATKIAKINEKRAPLDKHVKISLPEPFAPNKCEGYSILSFNT